MLISGDCVGQYLLRSIPITSFERLFRLPLRLLPFLVRFSCVHEVAVVRCMCPQFFEMRSLGSVPEIILGLSQWIQWP